MMSTSDVFELGLQREAMFSVPDAAGLSIVCRRGTVWITLDGDVRDFVLERCESFSTAEHRRALIYAMQPACISISQVAGAPARNLVLQQIPHH